MPEVEITTSDNMPINEFDLLCTIQGVEIKINVSGYPEGGEMLALQAIHAVADPGYLAQIAAGFASADGWEEADD